MFNRRKALVPAVGLATAAVTTVAGFAPALAAPDTGSDDVSAAPSADPTKDGTYESCSAYFGFGKEEGAIDTVEFDVAVSGPAGTPAPTVENGGVSVILEIENTEGDVFECVPEEVTEEQWEAEYGAAGPIALPEYPGPGHYIFPSNSFIFTENVEIAPLAVNDTIGEVESVGFRVVHVADGYDLVSPTGLEPLESQIFDLGLLEEGIFDPRVTAYVAGAAGTDAADALDAALDACIAEEEPEQSEALLAAVQALAVRIGFPDSELPEPPIECDSVGLLYILGSLVLSIDATTDYTKVIDLAVPTTPTTPTTPAARPAVVTPRFTG